MPTLPKAGVEVVADKSAWDSSYKDILGDASRLDSLAPTVKVGVNDADLRTAAGLAADLDTSVTTRVNVDGADLETVSDQLNTLTSISAIDLAINLSGTAVGFFESLGRFSGVGGIFELDNALASIEGRTGRMIPNAERLIEDLYINGWGESREAIANAIVEASNLKIANEDLAEATLGAFHVQSVSGEETNLILRTMDSLVKNNLVPDYKTASDLIVTGFQTGNDRGQDLLDTFNEYGSTFQNLRISGEGALGLINSGLDAGVDNSDRIADAIRETGIRLGEIGTTPAITDAFTRLDELSDVDLSGMLDAFNAGEISGDQFFSGFFTALGDAVAADPVEAQVLAAALVGTISEDFGVESVAQLTPVWDETMGTLEGRAETAGNTISDTLAVSLDTFFRNVEQAAVDLLSSDAIDLPGKIETLKKQIQDAAATLASGGTLGEALEISFGITGVDTALANIQRVFGQLVISLLEIVASIQDPTGLGSADNATRAEIARLAGQQLPFDLKVANEDEIGAIISQAAARGVSTEGLGGAVETALNELFSEGNFEGGLNLIDGLIAAAVESGGDPAAAQALMDKYATQLNTAFDEAIANQDFDVAEKIATAQNDPTKFTDALRGLFGFDAASFDTMIADSMQGIQDQIATESWWDDIVPSDVTTSFDDVKTSINDFNTNTETAMNNAALVSGLASQGMVDALSAMSDQANLTDQQVTNAMTGNTVTTSFQTVASVARVTMADVIAAVSSVFPVIAQLDTALKQIAATATAVQQTAMTAISTAGAAASTVNNTTINVNQNNTINGGAQSAANGYELAAQVRGMG